MAAQNLKEQVCTDQQQNQASIRERQAKEIEHLRNVADARFNVAYMIYVEMQQYKRVLKIIIFLLGATEVEDVLTSLEEETMKEFEAKYNLEFNINVPPPNSSSVHALSLAGQGSMANLEEQVSNNQQENEDCIIERQAKEIEHLRNVGDARLNVGYKCYVKMQKYKTVHDLVKSRLEKSKRNEAIIDGIEFEMTPLEAEVMKECESIYDLECGNVPPKS